MTANGHWWDPRNLAEHDSLCLRLGPLDLWIENLPSTWELAWDRGDEEAHMMRCEIGHGERPPAGAARQRYVFGRGVTALRVSPVLADRAFVVKAYDPVFVPSGEEVTLYISSPAQVRIEVGNPLQALLDLPVMLLSDTFFGPSTREGELAYAARTHARHSLAELPRRPHRIITPVRIRNEADSLLPIEKISIPLPLLSVYGASDGSLWTDTVTLDRESDSDLAALRVQKGAPQAARGASQISEPRRSLERGKLIRAFSLAFS